MEQIEEGRRREAAALAETAGRRWRSEIDEHGEQTVVWGDIPVEIAPDPDEPYTWQREYVAGRRVTFEDTFDDIFGEAFDLLIARQRKYGPTNIAQQGIYGVFKRIRDDKMARIGRVLNGRIVAGEIVLDALPDGDSDDTLEDALLDVANYALIMLALKRGVWGRPLAADVDG